MRLVFLGTGGSWPTKERNVSSVALKLNGDVLLFDCGEGTQRQIQHTSLSFMKVERILITHFHGDHFLGLPGLIQTMYQNDREAPLHIYGPEGTEQIVSATLELGYFKPTFQITIKDLKDGDCADCGGYTIQARDVNHGVPGLAFAVEEKKRPGKFDKPKALELGIPEGNLFSRLQRGETVTVGDKNFTPGMVLGPPRPGRKVVFSGDTVPCAGVCCLAEGADVLIHDSTGTTDIEEKMARYGHSTARQAAEVARDSNVRRLYLTHISPRYEEPEPLQDEARSIFQDSFVAEDLLEVEIPLPEKEWPEEPAPDMEKDTLE